MIEFETIPDNLEVPGVYFEFGSEGSAFLPDGEAVLYGVMSDGANATAEVLTRVVPDTEDALFGQGSMAARMVKRYREINPGAIPYVFPLADNGGAVSSLTITCPVTAVLATQSFDFNVGGRNFRLTLEKDDTNADVTALIVATINADTQCPLVASVATTDVLLSARHGGEFFDGIRATINPALGANAHGLAISGGLVGTTAGGGGTAYTLVGKLEGNIPERMFCDYHANPFADSINIGAFEAFLSEASGAWNFTSQSYGMAVSHFNGSDSAINNLVGAIDNKLISVMVLLGSDTPDYEITAAVAGEYRRNFKDASKLARPLSGNLLRGISVKDADIPSHALRQSYYATSGAGSYVKTVAGTLQIDRAVTTYKTNGSGAADATYRQPQNVAALQFIARDLINSFRSEFSNSVINSETLEKALSFYIAKAIEFQSRGVIEDAQYTIDRLVVKRNETDEGVVLNANRIDALFPVKHLSPLLISANRVSSSL